MKKKGTPLWKNTIFILFFSLCVSMGGLWYVVSYSGVFSLKDFSILGTSDISSIPYMEAAQHVINAPSLLPRNSVFFFPSERISHVLLASFPEIKGVAVERDFFQQKVTLRVSERKAVALLCEEQGACVSVDEEGIAIQKEDNRSLFPLFFTSDTKNFVLGKAVLEQSLLGTLLNFKHGLENWAFFREQGLSIFSFSLSDSKKIGVRFSEGWIAFINSEEDMGWQKEKLMQVLEKQVSQEKRKYLEYIDVRFGDQAYVKYQ